jgi:stage II sporulation protein D
MISVGVMATEGEIHFHVVRPFRMTQDAGLVPGDYTVRRSGDRLSVLDASARGITEDQTIRLLPESPGAGHLILRDVPVGMGFHWHQRQDLSFQGELHFRPSGEKHLQVIHTLPLETYLCSVIGSEMSGGAPLEFLKAHAVISRGWALKRIRPRAHPAFSETSPGETRGEETIQRWTSSEIHADFDVCADDHCQRYRGLLSDTASGLKRAVMDTRGEVLTHKNRICDTRYSKCCGGMTENFRAAWGDQDIPYLRSLPDNDRSPAGYFPPLSEEKNARTWITGSPNAFCNIREEAILEAVLLPLDRPTTDFFRWETTYRQEEISRIVAEKTGKDLGAIRDLLPLERGGSGRIIHLRIIGTKGSLSVGKELEIRRTLSTTHLYSSAFVPEAEPIDDRVPRSFRLIGAGWGHGVGLCQIGAAVMATRKKTYRRILRHYFPGTSVRKDYGGGKVR